MRREVVRSRAIVFGLLGAAIVIGLGFSTSPKAATGTHHTSEHKNPRRSFRGKTMLVGIVLPEGCLPGHTCSASLVTDSDEFADSPGVVVRRIRVPERRSSRGHATLNGLVVATNTANDQPADGPITFKAPESGSPSELGLTVALAESTSEIVDVTVGQLPPDRTNHPPSHPSMAPIIPDNGLCVVRDRFTGDGRATRIKVNGIEVPTLAQSQSVLAIAPRAALRQGKNEFEITNGGHTSFYAAWSPDVSIDADKTTLEQGESTQFRVKVKLGVIPHRYWSSSAPDLGGATKGEGTSAPGSNGRIVLTIKNDSESTASMSGGETITVPLQESVLADGSYTYSGTITGRQPGPLQIEASTDGQLADAPPVRTVENGTGTPTASQTPQPGERPSSTERTPQPKRTQTENIPTEQATPVTHRELGPPVVYVPETPVANVPKCCVITSITITNTSNQRVFYILNGRYVAGMSPPRDQWVEPGQSRTYTGDFGECVRIEAIQNQGTDENGDPKTGIFADQTVCCTDILTGKAKVSGIAIKINSIEWREWKDCPEKPPVPVAPPTPVIVRTKTPKPTPTKTPKRTPTPTPTETATEIGTPYGPETPIIYRPEETPVPLCCGITGNLITYPVTSDPMEVPKDPEAPRDVAAAGYQVMLHNGAFFENQNDITVDALAFPVEWTRHWRGKLTFKDGGIIGDGWDFSYNKRIVPIAPRRLSDGLFAERLGIDKAALTYYNGQNRAEVEHEVHSEPRKIFNFDARFEAWVTTYKAPAGSFHEIERYVLLPRSHHPFAGHVNVEPGERIFYVLREKNGTRDVFNCRGQLIYILSRNDNTVHHVRVELQYLGDLNPLTQNPMLSKLIDASGHVFDVTTINIHRGTISTNIKCKLVAGEYPIPRIRSVSGAGFSVRYEYRNNSTEPILEAAVVDTHDSSQRWEYTYDGANRMTGMKLPKESDQGPAGKPFFVNTYDGEGRVGTQNVGGIKREIKYQGAGARITDAAGLKEYALEKAGGYPVIESVTVNDKSGKSWKTKYEHNDFTQVTRLINPLGNGVKYDYEPGSAHVTLGPIRDWIDRDYTYESNLAQGNLLEITLFALPGDTGTITSKQTYELLYNQTDHSTDSLGNPTVTTFEYLKPGNRGNPITVKGPPVAQPDGGSVPSSLTTFTYNDFGQRTDTESGNGHHTHFDYDPRHYLNHIDYPGGSNETFENSARGEVVEKHGTGGTVTYKRNGRGLVALKKVGPDGLHIWTKFDYDLNDNVTDTTLHIEDTFGPNASKYGLYDLVDTNRELHTDYDLLNRHTKRTLKADGKSLVTIYDYGLAGELSAVHSPSFSAAGEYLTTDKYDARGLITEEISADKSKVAVKTCTTYDDNGRPTHVDRLPAKTPCPSYDANAGAGSGATASTIFDGFDRPISNTDSLGAEHIYKYDADGNVEHVEISGPTGRPDEARQLLYSADHKFDAYGHEISRSIDGLEGGGIAKTKYYYDGDLQLRKQRNPYGGEMTFDYNAAGHVEDVTDPAGGKFHNVYDPAGNLKHIEETDLEQAFNRGSGSYTAKKTTYVTENTYDASGRLTDVTAPAGTQHIFYDSIGEVRAVSSSAEGLTRYQYDGFGRRTEVAHGDSRYKTVYTPGGLVSESTATADNGLATTAHEKFDYDQIGHATTRTNVLSGGITQFKYDKLGRQNMVIDPNSTEVHRRLNDAGLPEEVTVKFPTGVGVRVNGRLVSAVSGPSLMTYSWDGLGRVVSGATNQASEVEFKYDGLGRVLEETQSYGAQRQTVKHQYDPDGKWADTLYPDMAGGGRVRNLFDTLERTTEVDYNGHLLASYLYTAAERIAQQTAGNGTKMRFDYDNRRRLTREEVAVGIPATGDTLWSETATYNEGLLKTVQEVAQPTDTEPGRVMSTTLGYDNIGRVTSSATTRASLTPGTSAMVEASGSFSEFEGGRLKKMAEYLRDDINGITQLERCDTFDYTPDGQVESLSSIGRLKGKSTASPTSLDEVESHITADPTTSAKQGYFYDHKGNLTYDGRFVYAYDYSDHLLSVEDTWAPFRYNEAMSLVYDAFGRRIRFNPSRDRVPKGLVRWGGEWNKSSQWFVYDGARVIAEIVPNPPKPAPDNVLLARYFFGARVDQRIRMDRRPENDLAAGLETFYFHDDLQGNIKFISNEDGKAAFAANREPTPGTEDAAPERPPGDENFIGGTEIRMPYLADATRLDGFAGTVSREDAQKPIYNYRSAFLFSKQLDQSVLHDSITAQQNRLLAVFGAMAAVPLVLPAAATGAAAAGAQSLIVAGMMGGLLNSGMNFYAASHTQSDYSSGDMLKDFGGGALMGVSGGVVQGFGYGVLATNLIEFGVNTTAGTLWDVGTTGKGWDDALSENAIASAQMAVIGAGIGVANKALRGAFGVAGEAIEAGGSSRRSAPGAKAEAPQSALAASTEHDIEILIDDQMPDREMLTLPISAEEEAFDATLMYELQNGTAHSAEIARRIALPLSDPEAMRIKFEDMECGGCAGEFNHNTRTIHINTSEIESIADGRWRTRAVASTIVHEGIHAMGGGELAAHIGQAQFLISRSAKLRWKLFAFEDVVRTDAPYLKEPYLKLIETYREGTMAGWYRYFARFQTYRSSPHLRRIFVGEVLDLSTNAKVREHMPIDPFLRETPFPPAGRIGENLNERMFEP